MTKKNFQARRRLDHRSVRLGAIAFLSAAGLALFAIVMQATPSAAQVAEAPAWGKVLIATGLDFAFLYTGVPMAEPNDFNLSSTELYDPATNSFAAAADTVSMNAGRYGATATLLASGKVLIAGGSNLSSTEFYDPATNSFAAADTASMNAGRSGATATLLPRGRVLITGGCCDASGNSLSSTELYDPAANSFAPAADTASMNTARGGASATLLPSGKVLIAGGGATYSAPGRVAFYPLSSTELYDPATNSFAAATDTASMNTARNGATATLLASGKILIAGGFDSSGNSLSSTELYDPATNSFATAADTASMNTARSAATATLLASGKVLIAGGSYETSGPGFASLYPLWSTELYDPTTNSFAPAADTASMNAARSAATATLLPSGKVLIAGGSYETSGPGFASLYPLWSTELYDPTTNSFAPAADTVSMNTARYGAQAILLPAAPTLLSWTLDFGTVKVGETSHASMVTLSNETSENLTISRAPIGSDFEIFLTTCASVLKAGQSCNYWLTFHPKGPGTKNELFRVFDNASDSPQKIELRGVATRR